MGSLQGHQSNHSSHSNQSSDFDSNLKANTDPSPYTHLHIRPSSSSIPARKSSSRNSTAFISFSSIKSSARRITTSLAPVKQPEANHSLGQESPPRVSTDRSSTSSTRSPRTIQRLKTASSSAASLPCLPDPEATSQNPIERHLRPSPSFPAQSAPRGLRKVERSVTLSAIPNEKTSRPFNSLTMIVTPFANNLRPENGKPPSSSQSNSAFTQAGNVAPLPGSSLSAGYSSAPPGSLHNPNTVYHTIQELSSKRIATLDYLRKAHEGRVYWFNTLLFSKADLSRMPYFESKKLSRRATNYLLLGLSLPTVLDMNASSVLEYLRTLNALLLEFESYQQIHPPEGSSASSLSRARIPQMFKRATHAAGTKGRRTSSATEIGLPMHSSDPADLKAMVAGGVNGGSSTTSSFPMNEQELLPGEEYTYLLTPSLPFDPDFFETFTTLCDVLIDCYTRIMNLVPSPLMCAPGVGEIFTKADARLKKIIVTGIVKEFEEASRSGAKNEMAGVSKVVLGGLI